MKISDLVNKVEPFCFEFDGEKLSGTYYKYKTSTPNYLKALGETIPDEVTEGTDEEKKTAAEARTKASLNAGLSLVGDMIATWDAEGDDGPLPLPLTMETLESWPNPFTEAFMDFFKKLREGNPTNGNGSQLGSQIQPIPTSENAPIGT